MARYGIIQGLGSISLNRDDSGTPRDLLVMDGTFGGGAATLVAAAAAVASGDAGIGLTITLGAGDGAGAGGAFSGTTGGGGATGASGAMDLFTGPGGATSGASGTLNLGTGGTVAGASGAANLRTGDALGAAAGAILVAPGSSDTLGSGVTVRGGINNGAGGTSGSATLQGANAGGTNAFGGSANILAGDGTGTGAGSNVRIQPGTGGVADGVIQLAPKTGASAPELRFFEDQASGSNYVGFVAPAALAGDQTYIWPGADGSSGQHLTTNGSGVLSWSDAGSVMTFTGSFTAGGAAEVINHALGSQYVNVTFWDDSDLQVFPDNTTATDANNITVDSSSFTAVTWNVRITA